MSTVFQDAPAKQLMESWFDRFRARLSVPTESRQVATRFGPTHVLSGGPPSGPDLVVLHGALASSAHALVELAPLLQHFRVHAVDIVGQSVKSAEVRPSVANQDYGHWLEDVLDGLGLARTLLVGVSWGGFVSLRLAAHAPQRIERLALLVPAGVVSGPAWRGFKEIGWPMTLYRWFPTEARKQACVRSLLTTPGGDWADYLPDAVRSFNLDMRVPALARPEELKAFTAPTLVIAADADLSFPGRKLLARASVLLPSRLQTELVEDCRHCPPTTEAFRGWLGERLRSFLLAA